MNRQFPYFNSSCKMLATVLCTLVISACGGGGGGSDAATNSAAAPVTPSQPQSNTSTVTGAVTKGPVAGSSLEFYEIDNFGFGVGVPVATATTNADGTFTATIPANSGNLLIVASGGSFIDESDQETDPALKRKISLTSSQFFLGLLPQGSTTAAVNPFIDVLIERARFLGSVDGSFMTRFNQAKAVFDAQTGFDVLSTIPANPIAPAAGATNAQLQYAMLLGGLANVINNVAIQLGLPAPTYDVVVAVTLDLLDGQVDGMQFDQPQEIVINDNVRTLPTNVDFTAEINRFKNNNFSSFSGTTLPTFNASGLANSPPTANAGVDQTVSKAIGVTLDGSGSIDPDSGVTYSWTQTAGTAVTLTNANTASPTFTSPDVLLGSQNLTFSLTVSDPLGQTSTDTVVVTVNGALPAKFFLTDLNEYGDGIGENIDGGGRLSFNTDGTGMLIDDSGVENFTYTVTGPVIRIDFPNGFLVDDNDEFIDANGDNIPEQFLVEEIADFFELTLIQDNPNGDDLTLREVGNRVFTPINGNTLTIPTEAYEFTDPVKVYDYAQQTPFSLAAGDRRTLLFNVNPVFGSTLFDDDELQLDTFVFDGNGVGATENNGVAFTYTIQPDGHLSVVFATGDTAEYYNMFTRPAGDVVATEYTLTTPFYPEDGPLLSYATLSFQKPATASFPTDLASLAGVYSGLRDGRNFNTSKVSFRLNPDGTGSIESQLDANELASVPGIGQFTAPVSGICWSSPSNGTILVNSTQANGAVTPNSAETTPAICSGLQDTSIGQQNILSLYEISATGVKALNRRNGTSCENIPPNDCITPVFTPRSFKPFVVDRVALTAVPPATERDFADVSIGIPVTIDVLANDVARGLAIDPATVQIVLPPAGGTATVSMTGEVTYDPGTFTGRDLLEYRVNDTAGNPSTIGVVIVEVGAPNPAVAQSLFTTNVNGFVTFDATPSTDNGSIDSYHWKQLSGLPIGLDDPEMSTPTLSIGTQYNLAESDTIVYQVDVTDNDGITRSTNVTVNVEPIIPADFFTVSTLNPPFQFGRDIGNGALVKLFPGGTGEYTNEDGMTPMNWSATDTSLTIDFIGMGGLVGDTQTSFIDLDLDGMQEEVQISTLIDQFTYTLVNDNPRVDQFSRVTTGTVSKFDVTNGMPLPDEPFTGSEDQSFVSTSDGLPFTIANGEFRTFMTNVSTAIPTIAGSPIPPNAPAQIDHLQFIDATTGNAFFKQANFTHMLDTDNSLVINFADGEMARHFLLFSQPSGDVVATEYHYGDGSVRVFTELSFKDDPAVQWGTAPVPGIYETNASVELNNGTTISTPLYYRLHPDGTGQVESQFNDLTTGAPLGVFVNSAGICWQVVGSDLIISRTTAPDQVYSGSNIPGPSHCSLINSGSPDNTLVDFQRISHLFDINMNSEIREVSQNKVNQCAGDAMGCDPNILETTDFFPRIFQPVVPFNGDPPLAVPDNDSTAVDLPVTVNVLQNDIQGVSTIDSTTLSIEVNAANGEAVVNTGTGDITYTPNSGFIGQDLFYYRVRDMNNNLSTIGIVLIDVTSGL